MPLTKYCICGHPNLYTLEVPIFCASCGNKFEGSISVASKSKPIKKQIIIEDIDDVDDIDEEIEQPKLHKLYGQTSKKNRKRREINEDDIESGIDIDDLNINSLELVTPISTRKEKGVTLGQVIKEQKTGFERAKPKRINKKAEMAKFQLEAGLGGRKDISIEAPEDKD